ncbi:MAG: hypothetical protein HY001_03225 [Candidatus Portnoybacteria bacterium]|nr:hypothetical protein [Candidatus Portnoybacteria bacterium]
MKKVLTILLVALLLSITTVNLAEAATRVRGYYKPSTGSYVQPHLRSNPNSSRWDNWSSQGNYNPYTGKKGYRSWWNY